MMINYSKSSDLGPLCGEITGKNGKFSNLKFELKKKVKIYNIKINLLYIARQRNKQTIFLMEIHLSLTKIKTNFAFYNKSLLSLVPLPNLRLPRQRLLLRVEVCGLK